MDALFIHTAYRELTFGIPAATSASRVSRSATTSADLTCPDANVVTKTSLTSGWAVSARESAAAASWPLTASSRPGVSVYVVLPTVNDCACTVSPPHKDGPEANAFVAVSALRSVDFPTPGLPNRMMWTAPWSLMDLDRSVIECVVHKGEDEAPRKNKL